MAPAIVKCKIVGGKVALDFEISACSTVKDLKENISGKTKLDMDRQTLTCCGEEMELENLRSLESYGYAEAAVIRLDASPFPDDSRFDILVKYANHPYATISVMEKETVADLKANISRLLPIPACTMTLMLNRLGTSMEDGSHLSDYYLSEGTCIHVRRINGKNKMIYREDDDYLWKMIIFA